LAKNKNQFQLEERLSDVYAFWQLTKWLIDKVALDEMASW
jgi:hypothetical protein